MINKKGLIGLVTAVTVLNGCNNLNKLGEFTKITPIASSSKKFGDYLIEKQAWRVFADDFQKYTGSYTGIDLINFAKKADINKDFYLTEKEAKKELEFLTQ